jgi:hypothetical protein
MHKTLSHDIEEAEGRVRLTLTKILSLIHDVPPERIPEIQGDLDRALIKARSDARDTKAILKKK